MTSGTRAVIAATAASRESTRTEVRADLFPNDALEDGGLAVVRLDREHERQGLRPYHEEKEHRADGREHDDRAVLDTLSFERRQHHPPEIGEAIVPGPDAVAGRDELREPVAHSRVTYIRPPRRARKL